MYYMNRLTKRFCTPGYIYMATEMTAPLKHEDRWTLGLPDIIAGHNSNNCLNLKNSKTWCFSFLKKADSTWYHLLHLYISVLKCSLPWSKSSFPFWNETIKLSLLKRNNIALYVVLFMKQICQQLKYVSEGKSQRLGVYIAWKYKYILSSFINII